MLRYGSEDWTLSRSERRNAEAAVMTISMHVFGYELT
jgi:hypothetical protein